MNVFIMILNIFFIFNIAFFYICAVYWYGEFVSSEQEQVAANQSTTLDQTIDGETTNVTGLVIFGYVEYWFFPISGDPEKQWAQYVSVYFI